MQPLEGIHAGDFADYIGGESCVDYLYSSDLASDRSGIPTTTAMADGVGGGGGGGGEKAILTRLERKEIKKYPPPIPRVARTEKSPTALTPRLLKRYITADGRLIIKEEKVERYEYFEAHRRDGRLRLNLVPLTDGGVSDFASDAGEDNGGEEEVNESEACEEENSNVGKSDGENDNCVMERKHGDDLVGPEEKEEDPEAEDGNSPPLGGGSKCCNSCILGAAIPAVRPVLHT